MLSDFIEFCEDKTDGTITRILDDLVDEYLLIKGL